MSTWGEALYRCAERYHGVYHGKAGGAGDDAPSETLELMYNGTRMLLAPLATGKQGKSTYPLAAKVQTTFELNHRYSLCVRRLSFAGLLCDKLFGISGDTVKCGNRQCDSALRIQSDHAAFTKIVFTDKDLRKTLLKHRWMTVRVAPVGEDAHLHTLVVESDLSLDQKNMTPDGVLDAMILATFRVMRALTANSFPEDVPAAEPKKTKDSATHAAATPAEEAKTPGNADGQCEGECAAKDGVVD